MTYTILQLRTLIDQASKLGFWDDVTHYTEELKKLEGK